MEPQAAAAQPPATPTAQDPSKPQLGPPWTPPEDGFDWVKLVSGELLKGEILVMRQDSLEFESDVLEKVSLDWSDIAELYSPRPVMVLLDRRETLAGVLRVKDGKASVEGDERTSVDKAQILAIVPGDEREQDYWSAKVTLSLTARSGNTDQADTSSFIDIKRETAATRGRATYNATYSETEGQETVNNQRANMNYDIFVSSALFLSPIVLEVYRDPVQNIDSRVTPAVGLGYEIVDRSGMDWDVAVGAGYQEIRYSSVIPGEPTHDDDVKAIIGTFFEWDITSDVEFEAEYRGEFSVVDGGANNHNLRATLSLDLWRDLDLNVTGVWDRISEPNAASDGSVPESDDFRLMLGFGWEF